MNKDIKKLLYLPVIVVLLIVFWVLGFYLPIEGQRKVLDQRLNTLQGKVQDNVPEIKVQMLQIIVDSMKVRLDDRKARMYPEDDLLNLGKKIEHKCRQYGLVLKSISPDYKSLSQIADINSELIEMPLTIQFEGNFSQLTRFLDDIPDFDFVFHMNGFNISKEAEKSTILSIELKGVFLLRKSIKNDQSQLVLAGEKEIS